MNRAKDISRKLFICYEHVGKCWLRNALVKKLVDEIVGRCPKKS